MSMSEVVKKNLTVGGTVFAESRTVSGDAIIVHDEDVAAGDGGSLTTRTNDTAGTVTADALTHGISTGDRVDLYWTVAGVNYCARGATVGTVSGAVIPFTGAVGDALPAQDSDITISLCVELDLSVLGTNVNAIILYAEARGQFVFEDAGGIELAKVLGDGVVWDWHEDNGEDNPITGDSIIAVYVSHSDEDASKKMKVAVLYDND